MKREQKPKKVRYLNMTAMLLRNGDGTHGGGKRQKARRDRKNTKQALKRGDFE